MISGALLAQMFFTFTRSGVIQRLEVLGYSYTFTFLPKRNVPSVQQNQFVYEGEVPLHLGPFQLNPIIPKVSNMVSTCCGMDSPEKASVSKPTTIKNAANRPFIISD